MAYTRTLKGGQPVLPPLKDLGSMTQTIDLSEVAKTINPSQTQMERFASPVVQAASDTTKFSSTTSYGNDDKPIKAAGVYQLPGSDELLFDDYDEVE